MEYSKLVAITGMPGLFEMISSKSDGAIVKSVEDGATKFVSARIHSISHLESIEIYTVNENINLVDLFKQMAQSSETLPNEKDNKQLVAYFKKVYPDMDFERVYASDMKKMVKWFSIINEKNIELKLSDEPAAETEETKEEENQS